MKKLALIIFLVFVIGLFPRERDREVTAMPIVKFTRIGKASWYSKGDRGINRRTANNEIFNENALSCAMWGVAFGRKVKVTNLDNGKSIVVRVNDRGPSERYVRRGRIIDLTKKAFRELETTKKGVIDVQIEFL